jgi:hypothetical protein
MQAVGNMPFCTSYSFGVRGAYVGLRQKEKEEEKKKEKKKKRKKGKRGEETRQTDVDRQNISCSFFYGEKCGV